MNQKACVLSLAIGLLLLQTLFLYNSCSNTAIQEASLDSRLQGGDAILINAGDAYTKNKRVTLSFFRNFNEEEGTQMKISHLVDCSDGTWEDFSSTKSWNLRETNQIASAYVKYRGGTEEEVHESSCYGDNIFHDNKVPSISFLTKTVFSSQNSLQINFQAKDDGSGIKSTICSLSPSFEVTEKCKSAYTFSDLTEGSHHIYVKTVDEAGNEASQSHSFLVDKTPPRITFNEKPAHPSQQRRARFVFTVLETGSGIQKLECKLDTQNWQNCRKAITYNSLSEGKHTFRVRVFDRVGLSQEKSHSWTVDSLAPDCELASKPLSLSKEKTATFKFGSQEDNVGFSCFLLSRPSCSNGVSRCAHSGGFCESPKSHTLWEGDHTFTFHCRDDTGNTSSVSYNWRIDLTNPKIRLINFPQEFFHQRKFSFRYEASDKNGIESKQCSIYQGAERVSSCPSSLSPIKLTEGSYRLHITAKDRAGRISQLYRDFEVIRPYVQVESIFEVERKTVVDILFVVDNSGSMLPYHSELANRIDGFLDIIRNLDWNIAVTTVNAYLPTRPVEELLQPIVLKQDEHTYTFNQEPDEPHPGERTYVLRKNDDYNIVDENGEITDTVEEKIKLLQDTILSVGTDGKDKIANERGIQSTVRLIESRNTYPQSYFFRDRAAFVTIFISDEDEDNRGPERPPENLGTSPYRNNPQAFLDKILEVWPQKLFVSHSIIKQSLNDGCRLVVGSTYQRVSELTGGIVGSICATSYTDQLRRISEGVRELKRRVALSCEPQDKDFDGNVLDDIVITPSIQIDFRVHGRNLIFNENLPENNYSINYFCPRKTPYEISRPL